MTCELVIRDLGGTLRHVFELHIARLAPLLHVCVC